MSDTITCYRFVTDDLKSQNGDEQWAVGEWKKVDGELELCKTGLHACRTPYQSLTYVYGTRWFKAEARGTILEGDDKFCASEMRLVEEIPIKVIHQWAVDCAYRVLSIYEQHHPEDDRPRKALEAKQSWIDNPCEETFETTQIAARATTYTVWDATGAAWAAAKATGCAADRSATWVAKHAAGAAADAAWVAWDTRDAEVKWQREHLEELIQEALK